MIMKSLKFTAEQIPEIEQGRQTSTWRIFDDKELSVGDELQFINCDNATVFGYGLVGQIVIKRIKDLNEFDQDGHKKYDNLGQIITEFTRFYGPGVTADTIIKVVKYSFSKKRQAESVVKKDLTITEVKLYTDGGSRGNPGPSATGYVITDMDNNVVTSAGKYLGITTNNQAEYQAVQQGLTAALGLGAKTVHVYMDSLLVVNQMSGVFKIKNRELWPIHQAIKELVMRFSKVAFNHVPREMNKLADAEVNKILDLQEKDGIRSSLL